MELSSDIGVVIAVDLDGTLTLTDTLHESVVKLLSERPISVLMLPFWLIGGKAAFKAIVAGKVSLNPQTLPYNQPLITWLVTQRASGRKIALCTAANKRVAETVAVHLNLFDYVIASDSEINNAGGEKRRILEAQFGKNSYDYAGNSAADVEVWAGARYAIVVNATNTVAKSASKVAEVVKTFPPTPISLLHWRNVFRLHQWIKNMLLFVPLIAAHQISNVQSLATLILAFISFGLCASAVYIINDLLDLESDRKHSRKRYRPFSAAAVPIKYGVMIAPLSVTTSLSLALMVGPEFTAWLTVYFAITIAYSLFLKRYPIIDCLVLTVLYTLRIIAGGAAVSITPSFWLLAFSTFIFLSLAFVKRYAELQIQAAAGNARAFGRGYSVSDASIVQTFGITAGYLSVLVLALYLQGETVVTLYAQPELIWLAIPLMLFWVSWVWMKAHRGEMHDDPIIFALKNKASLITVVLIATLFVLASIGVSG